MKTSVKLDSGMKLEEEISFWNWILSAWPNRRTAINTCSGNSCSSVRC